MNKEELTQSIREGMNQHSEDLIWDIFKGVILGFIALIALVLIYSAIQSYRIPSPDINIINSPPQICNYPYVHCEVIELERYFVCPSSSNDVIFIDLGKSNFEKGIHVDFKSCEDVSSSHSKFVGKFCGYTEANIFYEQFKNNYKGNFSLSMECRDES